MHASIVYFQRQPSRHACSVGSFGVIGAGRSRSTPTRLSKSTKRSLLQLWLARTSHPVTLPWFVSRERKSPLRQAVLHPSEKRGEDPRSLSRNGAYKEIYQLGVHRPIFLCSEHPFYTPPSPLLQHAHTEARRKNLQMAPIMGSGHEKITV